MGYWIQRTYAKFVSKFSSLFLPVSAFSKIFFLAIITSIKFAKPILVFWIYFIRTLCGIILFPIIVKILDLRDVFPFFFGDVGISICCKKVIVTSLFPLLTMPRNFLMILVFFTSLILVGGRLLGVLTTKYVSRKSVSRLSLFEVFFFFFPRLDPLGTL